MSKRAAETTEVSVKSSKQTAENGPSASREPNSGENGADDVEMGEFEDPYGDEFESDGEIVEINDDVEDEDVAKLNEKAQLALEQDKQSQSQASTVYLPHKSKPLGPDEVLEADPSVYDMLHNINMPWPCLSLDVVADGLGDERRSFPMEMTVVTGTQAAKVKENELLVLKLSQLAKTLVKENDDDDDDDDDDDGNAFTGDPVMEHESLPVKSTTNRIRVSGNQLFTAAMFENGECCVYDINPQMRSLTNPGSSVAKAAKRPVYTVRNHGNVEGYGLDWSPTIDTGALLSGDVSGRVFHTKRTPSGWTTDKVPFTVESSIEDIQWSKSENTVFATADCDGYVRIWDTRSKKHKPSINVRASTSDVNVISWSSKVDYLLASGHDDGTWGVWDLRSFAPNKEKATPVALYDFHKAPVTSISFNPLDESVIAVASEDNTVTLWDLAVEADDEEVLQQKKDNKEIADIPPQLLFVHWQKNVKEVQWHKQIPGALVSTGGEGLNVWKTISV